MGSCHAKRVEGPHRSPSAFLRFEAAPGRKRREDKRGGRRHSWFPPAGVLSAGANAKCGSGARRGQVEGACVCRTKENATAGKRFVCPYCVGRRSPRIAVRETCADSGFAPWAGLRAPSGAAHFWRHSCSALDSAKYREAAVEEYKNRCDPLFARKDIFVVCPCMVDLRCASAVELRSALLRGGHSSGLEEMLGRGSEAPSGGTSLLLTSAQMCGRRMESAGSIRPSRAPHMECKFLLRKGGQCMGCALEYLSRVANETDSTLVRAVAEEREFICEALRMLYTPSVPSC